MPHRKVLIQVNTTRQIGYGDKNVQQHQNTGYRD